MAIAVAFTLMGVFFMAGLYVAGALGILSFIIMTVFSDAPLLNIMANRAWTNYTNWLLVAIPLFILMGELVLRSGFAERMYSAPFPLGRSHPRWIVAYQYCVLRDFCCLRRFQCRHRRHHQQSRVAFFPGPRL